MKLIEFPKTPPVRSAILDFLYESVNLQVVLPRISLPLNREGLATLWTEAQKHKEEVGTYIHLHCEQVVGPFIKRESDISFSSAINSRDTIARISVEIASLNSLAKKQGNNKVDFSVHQQLAYELQSILSLAIDHTTTPIKAQIQAGDYSIFAALKRSAFSASNHPDETPRARDTFVNSILGYKNTDLATEPLGIWMNGFEPTSADISIKVIEALEMCSADEFCDLGSGNGKLVHLCNLCTPARSRGIEFQAALHHEAERVAANLKLVRTKFIHADVSNADFGNSNIFYIFNSFTSEILEPVLKKLHEHSVKILKDKPESKFKVAAWDRSASVIEKKAPWLKFNQKVEGVSIFEV